MFTVLDRQTGRQLPSVAMFPRARDGMVWLSRDDHATRFSIIRMTADSPHPQDARRPFDLDPEIGPQIQHFQEETAFGASLGRSPFDEPASSAPRRTPVTEVGFYRQGGQIFKVVKSQAQRLYAQVLTPAGSWEYAPGWVVKLSADDRMTKDEAAEYGRAHGRCLVCGRTLTNPESIAAGIGPICAGRV